MGCAVGGGLAGSATSWTLCQHSFKVMQFSTFTSCVNGPPRHVSSHVIVTILGILLFCG